MFMVLIYVYNLIKKYLILHRNVISQHKKSTLNLKEIMNGINSVLQLEKLLNNQKYSLISLSNLE